MKSVYLLFTLTWKRGNFGLDDLNVLRINTLYGVRVRVLRRARQNQVVGQ